MFAVIRFEVVYFEVDEFDEFLERHFERVKVVVNSGFAMFVSDTEPLTIRVFDVVVWLFDVNQLCVVSLTPHRPEVVDSDIWFVNDVVDRVVSVRICKHLEKVDVREEDTCTLVLWRRSAVFARASQRVVLLQSVCDDGLQQCKLEIPSYM